MAEYLSILSERFWGTLYSILWLYESFEYRWIMLLYLQCPEECELCRKGIYSFKK